MGGTPSRGGAAAVAARRRPSVSLLQTYRTCWKPRNNHFLRPTDVRPREERHPTVAELSSQKMVVQRAQGWKLHHLSTQMEEMVRKLTNNVTMLCALFSVCFFTLTLMMLFVFIG
jgi:histone deacetylase complex subunit SAP130